MNRIVTIISLFCFVLLAHAQDEQQTKINRIKKSKEYLYSDMTMSTPEDATSQALDLLHQEIAAWAKDRADKEIDNYPSPVEINKVIDTIMVRRANMYRVFAYVKKFSLVPLFNKWNMVLLDDYDTDGVIASEDKHEKEEVIIPEEPKDSVANKDIRTLLKNHFVVRDDSVIEQIKKANTFFELKEIMQPLKEKGDILDYGKYATAKNPEQCYLIVYDPAGNIKAILDKGEEVRKNLNTDKEDSIKNYRGCGAIWFTIKE